MATSLAIKRERKRSKGKCRQQVDVSVDFLSNSQIVRLGDLGSLMLNVKSEGRDTPEEVTAAAIKGTSVIFTPGSRIKNMQATVKYQKA